MEGKGISSKHIREAVITGIQDKGKYFLRDIFFAIAAGVLSAININTFVNAGNLVPGGFSGLSLLLVRIGAKFFDVNLNYSILYLLFNIPSTLLVFRYVSKRFTIISLFHIATVSLMVQVVPKFEITNDLLLISVFGGIISGLAGTLVLRGNGCAGGTDFISIYFAKKNQRSVWTEIFLVNCIMLAVSGVLFGWDSALYSIIYQFAGTQIVKMFDNRYKRTSFIIISDKAQEIAHAVYEKYHHSVTLFDAIGGFTNTERTVIYTVVGQYESSKLISTILEIDPKAFINISDNQRIVGNFHEKPF